jgi:hypothetical protein
MEQHQIDVIRGDTKRMFVGLAAGVDLAEYPDWRVRLVIREAQDDALEPLFSQSLEVDDADVDPSWPAMAGAVQFVLTPDETSALPPYRVAYFVELHAPDESGRYRLFEGQVKIRD